MVSIAEAGASFLGPLASTVAENERVDRWLLAEVLAAPNPSVVLITALVTQWGDSLAGVTACGEMSRLSAGR